MYWSFTIFKKCTFDGFWLVSSTNFKLWTKSTGKLKRPPCLWKILNSVNIVWKPHGVAALPDWAITRPQTFTKSPAPRYPTIGLMSSKIFWKSEETAWEVQSALLSPKWTLLVGWIFYIFLLANSESRILALFSPSSSTTHPSLFDPPNIPQNPPNLTFYPHT